MSMRGVDVMDQQSLWDDRPDPAANRVGAAHWNASDTEQEAAMQIQPRSGTWRAKVLEEITRAGDDGATDWELHVRTGGLLYTIAPRRNELLNDGWIRDSGRRRVTPNGTRAIVWVLVDPT
jgi:hypothetical protein